MFDSKSIKQILKRLLGVDAAETRNHRLSEQIAELRMLTAKLLIPQMAADGSIREFADVEFKVFSQFGDDGIIQYLLRQVNVEVEAFVEFGVADYEEATTRFLLMNNNWRGLVLDGSKENVEFIQQRPYYWKYDLKAVDHWIDRETINDILREHGFSGRIGLLHIDVDGNDYWIWERLNIVDPVIVIVEYNSVFGGEHALTVPYDRLFDRTKAHASNLYWGASLKALCLLGEKKGYAFVGSNSSGNNAYFVRRDKLGRLRPLTAKEGFVYSKFRESRDAAGKLSYLSGQDRLTAIQEMPVYDVEWNHVARFKDVGGG